MRQAEERLSKWREDYQHIAAAKGSISGSGVDAFLALTLRNVMGSLTDLQHLGQALSGGTAPGEPCQLINCPRGAQLRAAVEETVAVLEETKSAFKSKALGGLRQKLELVLRHG